MPVYNYLDYLKIIRPLPKDWPRDVEGIPCIKKTFIDIHKMNNGLYLSPIDHANSNIQEKNKKILHAFKFDKELNRLYNQPIQFLNKVKGFYAVSTLDFSMHPEMSRAQIIESTFKNRWSGAWLQSNGIKNVAVSVGWVDEDTYDICFSGIEDGTLLLISTLGVCNKNCKTSFIKGFKEMKKRFPSSQIICLGSKVEGMEDNICYVPYKQSYDAGNKYSKVMLFNWDLSIED